MRKTFPWRIAVGRGFALDESFLLNSDPPGWFEFRGCVKKEDDPYRFDETWQGLRPTCSEPFFASFFFFFPSPLLSLPFPLSLAAGSARGAAAALRELDEEERTSDDC